MIILILFYLSRRLRVSSVNKIREASVASVKIFSAVGETELNKPIKEEEGERKGQIFRKQRTVGAEQSRRSRNKEFFFCYKGCSSGGCTEEIATSASAIPSAAQSADN